MSRSWKMSKVSFSPDLYSVQVQHAKKYGEVQWFENEMECVVWRKTRWQKLFDSRLFDCLPPSCFAFVSCFPFLNFSCLMLSSLLLPFQLSKSFPLIFELLFIFLVLSILKGRLRDGLGKNDFIWKQCYELLQAIHYKTTVSR